MGILVTRARDLHWFVDGVWKGVVPVRDYPKSKSMWGLVVVYGKCTQARAEICTGTLPPISVAYTFCQSFAFVYRY